MPLTPEEREIAAARAERYPPDRGGSFFSGTTIQNSREAALFLEEYPDAWRHG